MAPSDSYRSRHFRWRTRPDCERRKEERGERAESIGGGETIK